MMRKLVELTSTLQEREALAYVEQALREGVSPDSLLQDARDGLRLVGEKFSAGEFFIPDLVFSGEIMKAIVRMLEPHLRGADTAPRVPRIVVGTVAGDIHDIGKNLVTFMLDIHGLGVLDLGVDVSVTNFVDAVKKPEIKVVALSGFLTLAFKSMKDTIDAIAEAGLRDRIKIMIGGGQVDEQIRKYTGADSYGRDAMDAVNLARAWLGGE